MTDQPVQSYDWYRELGDLIEARGKAWFPSALQAALQTIFHYDYFLFVIFEKRRSAHILRSDFRRDDVLVALKSFQDGAYIIDPVFRLFANDRLRPGVFDVADLVANAGSLPPADVRKFARLLHDASADSGHRLIGWPDHVQETFIIVPIGATNVASISLYNAGLESEEIVDPAPLRVVFPALSKLVERHFETIAWSQHSWLDIAGFDPSKRELVKSENDQVRLFFSEQLAATLTDRETELFKRLLSGMSATAAAEDMGISLHTAKTHRRNVYRRIGHRRISELIGQYHTFLVG